jgi:NAD(P)-dependent dehydrogenase (short-subunit alcohol dehydrogenase family)
MATIFITGAGQGIGRALVDVFTERGDSVIALSRADPHFTDPKSQYHHSVMPIAGDVGDDACEAAIATALLTYKISSLDILINNAGIGGTGQSISDVEPSEMIRLFQTNCMGALRCTRACLPYLRAAKHPLVINISSRLGSMSWNEAHPSIAKKHSYSYRISKASLNMLTVCMALELESIGIRVVSVHPGTVLTRLGSPDAKLSPRAAAESLVGLLATDLRGPQFLGPDGESYAW